MNAHFFTQNDIPVTVYIEPTLRCNLKCVHCYVEKPGANPSELRRNDYRQLFRDLAELGTLYIVFTGGEVFLRPDFLDILGDARALGFATIVYTNGTLIDKGTVERLYDLAVLGVEISIYSATASVHDSVTGVAGSFERSIASVRMLHERGINAKMKMMLLEPNDGNYKPVIDLADEIGVDYVVSAKIFPRRDSDTHPQELTVADDAIRTLYSDPVVLSRMKKRIPPPKMLERRVCGAACNVMRIDSGGNVFPCVSFPINAGNVLDSSVVSIWKESKEFNQLRSLKNKDLEKCRTCEYLSSCARCPAVAYTETGDLAGCSPTALKFAKILKR